MRKTFMSNNKKEEPQYKLTLLGFLKSILGPVMMYDIFIKELELFLRREEDADGGKSTAAIILTKEKVRRLDLVYITKK